MVIQERFCESVGSEFLDSRAECVFPAFVHAGMRVVWGNNDLEAIKEYRTAWFEDDGMVIDSSDHNDTWWRDEKNKTLPAQAVMLISSHRSLDIRLTDALLSFVAQSVAANDRHSI